MPSPLTGGNALARMAAAGRPLQVLVAEVTDAAASALAAAPDLGDVWAAAVREAVRARRAAAFRHLDYYKNVGLQASSA